MNPWPLFRAFLKTTISQDEALKILSKFSEKDDAAFEELLYKLHTLLKRWWESIQNEHPNAIGAYYMDEAAMKSYESRQSTAIPAREDLFDMALDTLEPLAGSTVLEVCSGSGAGALRLRQRGAKVIATDAFPILTVHADILEAQGVHVLRDLDKGDLRKDDWCQQKTYEPFLGKEFPGFSGILAFMGLPLIADRDTVYRGMRKLLVDGGRIAIVHDPEVFGRPLPTSVQTIRGIARTLLDQRRPKTMLEITANILMRRGILHGEHRKTADEETSLIIATFGNCAVERHGYYPEWALFTAKK